MDIVFIIISIVLEAAFIFIAIKSAKSDKINNILLFFGIPICIFATGSLAGNPFRYLFMIAFLFILLKFIYKRNAKNYDVFLLNIILGFKFSLEFIIFIIFHRNYKSIPFYHMAIVGFILFVIMLFLRPLLQKIYNKIVYFFSKSEAFYLRFGLFILSVLAVMSFYYYMINYPVLN